MGRIKRKASTFPEEFGQLLYYVSTTRKPVVVDNLGKDRKKYTSFIARVHEFRRAFHNEAMASSDPDRMKLADKYYSVTLRNPQLVEGRWQIVVEPKDEGFGAAITKLLDDAPEIPKAGSAAIGSYLDDE